MYAIIMGENVVQAATMQELKDYCKDHGLRLMPQMNGDLLVFEKDKTPACGQVYKLNRYLVKIG